jgi:hypothetical protein
MVVSPGGFEQLRLQMRDHNSSHEKCPELADLYCAALGSCTGAKRVSKHVAMQQLWIAHFFTDVPGVSLIGHTLRE